MFHVKHFSQGLKKAQFFFVYNEYFTPHFRQFKKVKKILAF